MTTAYNDPIPYNSALNYNGSAPIVTAKILPTLALKVRSKTGAVSPLPEAQIDSMAFEDSSVSAISVKVPSGTVGASLVGDYSIFELTMNGAPVQDGRWLVRGQNWNAGLKSQVKSFTARHLLWDRLEHTRIWNDRRYLYAAKTPGYILNDLFLTAQLRDVGYWDNFTWTFNATVDSAGRAWPTSLGSLEYLPTAKYSDVISNLVDKGVIEIHLLGDQIQAFVPDTTGRTTPALLVVGEDVTDAPQQSSADNIVSDVIVLGDDSVSVVRSNPLTSVTFWREEDGISQGGTKDIGTLSIFGDVALSAGDGPRVQRTYELVITQERPFLPVRDYVVGDWVRVQHGDEAVASYRVKQITMKQDNGRWTGSLVLNDKFIENEIRLTKKVDGIIGGATITGSAQTTDSETRDTGIPTAPTGVTGNAAQYIDANGITKVVGTFTWAAPLLNTDGSPVSDIDHYRAAWRYTDDPPARPWQWRDTDGAVTTMAISPLDPGRTLMFYVRAIDQVGNWSINQPTPFMLDLGTDTIPPPQTSTPLASSIMKQLIIEWDGLDVAGQPMPPDFSHIEIWTSASSGFTPGDAGSARNGTLTKAGQFYLTSFAYPIGTTAYIKFVAVDRTGNKSPASVENPEVIVGISGPDIAANSIVANNIAAGAVTAQAIAAGAITSQKINIGQTVNLVVDPSFNDPDWRARRDSTEWAEKPSMWFFTTGFIDRNGYYLQALSSPNEGGGRMYITDYIYTQVGETYYAGIYARNGQFAPNVEARIRLGVEVTSKDGSVTPTWVDFDPTGSWQKFGYQFVINNLDWVKVRFYIQAIDMVSGDIAIDDLEVRGGVGTTQYAGSRGLLDPTGLYAYDGSDQQTLFVNFATGDIIARGQIVSGVTGKRTIINPTATYLPEIRFYPSASEQYAYINAVDSVGGGVPFIGVNAPDTGAASYALILYDTGFQLAEINKSTAVPEGPGFWGTGNGISGGMHIYGKFNGANGTSYEGIGAWRFSGLTPSAANSYVITMTKPAAPASGQWLLIYSIRRNAGQRFTHQITAESTSSCNVSLYCAVSGGVDLPTFTNTPIAISHLWVRTDGDT